MSLYVFFRRASVLAIFSALFFVAANIHAAEQWSWDLWKEEPQQGSQPSTGSTPVGPLGPGNTQEGPSSGSGLWSEQPWVLPPNPGVPTPPTHPISPAHPVNPTTPAKPITLPTDLPPITQPIQPIQDPPPGPPIQGPKPGVKPAPTAGNAASDAIVMQIGNSKAIVRGQERELSVPPAMINDRTMVPLRFIGEAFEATFAWESAERKAVMELNGSKVEVWIGRTTARINGQGVKLDAPPVTLNGVTMVPLRFISEHFGYSVEFDQRNRIITISEQTQESTREQGATVAESEQTESEVEPESRPEVEPTVEPEIEPEPEPEAEPELHYNYIGEWALHLDGRMQGIPMGTLTVYKNGTYRIVHAVNGTVEGRWRVGSADEVITHKHMLVLENGPTGVDWVMIPKNEDIVSVRYHYGYTGATKIWFEDSLGIRRSN